MRLDRRWIGRSVRVVMDRPLGSAHPDYPDLIYSVNYGYIPGTMAADGEPVDAYVLGPQEPLRSFEGKVIGLIHRADDIEDKLVVADKEMTAQDIMDQVYFQEKNYESVVEI